MSSQERSKEAELKTQREALLIDSLPTLPLVAGEGEPTLTGATDRGPAESGTPSPNTTTTTATTTQAAAEVQAAQSESALKWDKALGSRAMVAWVVVAIVTALCFLAVHKDVDRAFGALLIAIGVISVALTTLWAINRETGGFLQAIRSGDGRISTSLAQGALWTVLLALAFVLFAAQYALGITGKDTFDANMSDFAPTYLLLLGGPFAAAAALRVNYSIRKDDGSVQKASDVGMQLKDVVTDDAGQANLNDSQFFVFNLVAAATFIVMLAKAPTALPLLPDTLVALTSIAALAYVTTKTVSNQRPTITTIVTASVTGTAPTSIEIGTLIDIRGANFTVAGTDAPVDIAQVRVKFGTVEVGVLAKRPDGSLSVTATSIYVNVPDISAATYPANVDVIVVTATGAMSEKYPLTVAARAAV